MPKLNECPSSSIQVNSKFKSAAKSSSPSPIKNSNEITKNRRKRKQPIMKEENDVYQEDEFDRNERAGSLNSVNSANVQTTTLPKDMYKFCKYLLDLEDQKKLYISSKKGNVKFHNLLQNTSDLDPSIDLASMQTSFVIFYRWASSLSEIPLTDALKRVIDYVQGDHILQKYPGYPKRPASKWNFYLQSQGLNPFKSGEMDRINYKNEDNQRVIEAEKEHLKAKRTYIEQLRQFLEVYSDSLFANQIEQIQKEINRSVKALEEEQPKEGKTKQKNVKLQQPKPTAFDLYKRTMEEKYKDLSEDEREKKLRKRYNKLDLEQRQIYESIADKL